MLRKRGEEEGRRRIADKRMKVVMVGEEEEIQEAVAAPAAF
jgi:hypothetical protein